MTEHYFAQEPTSAIKTKEVATTILNHRFMFITVSGVFSYGQIDKASLLLAEHAIIKKEWSVLDLGCGWGLIGIVVKKVYPSASVTMTEINKRAIEFAKKNVKRNRVDATIAQGNLYEPVKGKEFDTILVNPPMKAGRELCYAIIEQSKSHLKKDALLQLVAVHNRGGSMLEKKMNDVFGNVQAIAKKGGIRVYCSRLTAP